MKKLITVLMALLMAVTMLAGCKPKEEPAVRYDVNFGVLKGPTGIGASYLLEKNSKGVWRICTALRINCRN